MCVQCYRNLIVASSYCCAKFGPGYGPVWLSNLGCTGSDSNLFSCSQDTIGSNTCPHTKDAGASCRGGMLLLKHALINVYCVGEITTSCHTGDVRLYRPYGTGPANDGLALYCNNSHWVGVCDDGWSCYNAKLFCKKLGYPGALSK